MREEKEEEIKLKQEPSFSPLSKEQKDTELREGQDIKIFFSSDEEGQFEVKVSILSSNCWKGLIPKSFEEEEGFEIIQKPLS